MFLCPWWLCFLCPVLTCSKNFWICLQVNMFHNTPLVPLSCENEIIHHCFHAWWQCFSYLHCQGNTVLSMCYKKKHLSKIFGHDCGVLQFVFSISQLKNVNIVPSGACFFVWQKCPCISYVLWSQNISKGESQSVMWTVVQDFSANLPQTVAPISSPNSPFCHRKAAFQLSHHLLSIYLPHSNCDLSLCWTPASVLTPAKSMD